MYTTCNETMSHDVTRIHKHMILTPKRYLFEGFELVTKASCSRFTPNTWFTPNHGLHQPPFTPNHGLHQPQFTPKHSLHQPLFTPTMFTPHHVLHQPPSKPSHALHQTTVYTKPRSTPTTIYTKPRSTPTTVHTKARFTPSRVYTNHRLHQPRSTPTTVYTKSRFTPRENIFVEIPAVIVHCLAYLLLRLLVNRAFAVCCCCCWLLFLLLLLGWLCVSCVGVVLGGTVWALSSFVLHHMLLYRILCFVLRSIVVNTIIRLSWTLLYHIVSHCVHSTYNLLSFTVCCLISGTYILRGATCIQQCLQFAICYYVSFFLLPMHCMALRYILAHGIVLD